MTKIEYSTDEQLQELHADALRVLHNLGYWTKYWEKHYGSDARNAKKRWEKRADELLNGFGLTEHNNTKAIQIIKTENV